MKHSLLRLCMVLCMTSLVGMVRVAALPVFVVDGDSLSHMDAICLGHGNGETVTVSYIEETLKGQNDNFTASWQAIGDLEIISRNGTSATFRSTNFGKGVARLYYNNSACGSAVDLHIYKDFDPADYGLEIEGPDCLTPGETVVFSVRPVLTRNLNAYIGVDSYYWNLTDTGADKPSFVDHIVYAAGDGSSVTFVAGTIHAGDEVRVNFGQCNTAPSKAVTKSLGKIPPKPEVIDLLCVPYVDAIVRRIEVINPVEGVRYTCDVPSQYSAVQVQSATGVAFDVTFDQGSANDIYIRATYDGEEACGSSEALVQVVRTWGDSVALSYKGEDDVCCASVTGPSCEFSLDGDVPTNSMVYWDLPTGWVIDNMHSVGRSIHIRPTTSAAMVGTLRAWGDACNDEAVDTVAMVVYAQPASVAAIEGPACVSIGVPDTFRVVLNNDGVAPASFVWTTSDSMDLSTFTGNYAVITPTANTTTISVQPLGLQCDAEVFVDTLAFMPVAPRGIISPSCIAYNMPDTVTFSIKEPVANQQYAWTIPNGWSIVENRNNGSEVDVRTTGVAGEYVVGAYSVGAGICGNSAAVSVTVYINSISSSITCYDFLNMFTLLEYENTSDYYWYYVHNGTDVSVSVLENYTTRFVGWRGEIPIEEISATNNNTIVLEYTTATGCRARLTYGAPLNPAVDYRSLIPASAQRKNARQGVLDSEEKTLTLSPNPTSAELSVGLQDNSPFELYIIDMSGKIVYTGTSAQSTYLLNVSAWRQDTYLVFALQNGKRVSSSKFIKQ